mmetsp:Transcript_18723/g.47376  ORF Transcript_18723/g.47376 Transcript_18723/m.47376 type:complete len:203 (-) Transcript_18723:162-770(-)
MLSASIIIDPLLTARSVGKLVEKGSSITPPPLVFLFFTFSVPPSPLLAFAFTSSPPCMPSTSPLLFCMSRLTTLSWALNTLFFRSNIWPLFSPNLYSPLFLTATASFSAVISCEWLRALFKASGGSREVGALPSGSPSTCSSVSSSIVEPPPLVIERLLRGKPDGCTFFLPRSRLPPPIFPPFFVLPMSPFATLRDRVGVKA